MPPKGNEPRQGRRNNDATFPTPFQGLELISTETGGSHHRLISYVPSGQLDLSFELAKDAGGVISELHLVRRHASHSEAATAPALQWHFRKCRCYSFRVLPRVACIFFLCAAGFGSLSAKEPRQIREDDRAAFVGSIGCKSSSCHGGAGPKRNQYITWSRQDFHTKADAVLLNSRSERIAEGLGIAAAQSSARCTVCHSPLQSVAPSRLTRTAQPDEGVSCETCHGAAGGWLRGHTRPDWTHNIRVAAGMRDLRNLYLRANACVACHQNLAPELLKAGHPDLFFELDSQSVAEPKHWHDEEPWSGLRQWLTGQAVALREMSWALAHDPQNDAFSSARWNGLAWLCATTTAAGNIPSPVTMPSATASPPEFNRTQRESDALARHASVLEWSEGSARALLTALASMDTEFIEKGPPNASLAQRAKRLVLALDRLANALSQNRGTPLKIDSELNQLFQDVKTLDSFDASSFAGHLRTFRSALDKTG